jgi:mRNA interferase RelE/StbE
VRIERYAIEWASPAKRALGRFPEKVGTAAIEFIYGPLAENPRRVGRVLRFELAGLHSAHRGDFRILYRISEETHTVYIEVIAHRADVYRRP